MVKTSACISMLMVFLGQSIYAQPASFDKVLKKFDRNKDDRISFSEAPNHIQESFHIHDINRDGYISGTELGTMSLKPSSRKAPSSYPSAFKPPHRQGPPPQHNRPSHPPKRPSR